MFSVCRHAVYRTMYHDLVVLLALVTIALTFSVRRCVVYKLYVITQSSSPSSSSLHSRFCTPWHFRQNYK